MSYIIHNISDIFFREFSQLALDLLEQCYKTDDVFTQHLLTYELDHWSDQTCLSLAVCANHKELIAHTCCQILLTEMWMGALRLRKYTNLKVPTGHVTLLECIGQVSGMGFYGSSLTF